MAATAAGLLAIVPIALLAQRIAAVGKAHALEVGGAPCPRGWPANLSPTDLAPLHTTDVGGVLFTRRYGIMDCDYIATDHGRGLDHTPVCRFNNPTLLSITTARGRFAFYTGLSPATVTLAGSQPKCVLNAAFGR
jgi:hypothetical protein